MSEGSIAERSVLERMQVYQTKCVGRDMMLKTIVYALRLGTLHCGNNKALLTKLQVLILNIIDCRMLFNHWKYIGSFRLCLKTLKDPDTKPTATVIKAFTALSFAFRSVEQFSGDLSYVQKNWLTAEWSRPRISWHYKFNKSMSLTANAIVELIKILVLQAKIAKLELERRTPARHRRTNSGSVDSFITSPVNAPARSPVNENLDRAHASSPVAPEAGMTPDSKGGAASFPPMQLPSSVSNPSGVSGGVNKKTIDSDIADLTRQRNRCVLFFLRNIADMIVYYQWVTWYHPWFHLQYFCGLFSGLVGVKLVWEDS